MQAIMLTAALIATPPSMAEGTLLFLQNSKKLVEEVTDEDVSHVAIVLMHGGEPWVYEATPPKVRRLRLSRYMEEQHAMNRGRRRKVRLWMLEPSAPYDSIERAGLHQFLRGQLGRRYSVRNYVREEPGDGVHCAELASSALVRSGRFHFSSCGDENPGSLLRAIRPMYDRPARVAITSNGRSPSRCSRWWAATRRSFRWCGWSICEAWRFCW